MKRFITLVIAVAIVGAVILVDAADARACSPISETVLSTIPADGAHAPPNTRIIALTGGLTQGDKELTLTADDGQEISGQVVWDNMAGLFTGFRKFIPDDQLDPGEYSLHIDYEPIGMDDFEMSFIVPTVWEPWPQPEAVDFQWYQETFEKDRGDSCYYNDELNELAIEPLDIEPDYYEIIFHRSDGNERIRIHEPEDVDGELRAYELGDVDCVTVSAARIDGVHSVNARQNPRTQTSLRG